MKVLNRAESSTPAMPITRSRGKPDCLYAVCAIASSGLATTSRMQFGDAATALATTSLMILKLVFSRSSRLIPGLRAMPAVITTMSDPLVSA